MQRPVIVVSTTWLHLWYIARQAGYASVKSLVPPSLIYRMRVMNLTVHTLLTPRLFTWREGSLARIKDAMSFVRWKDFDISARVVLWIWRKGSHNYRSPMEHCLSLLLELLFLKELMKLNNILQGREKRLVNLVKQDPGKARQNS